MPATATRVEIASVTAELVARVRTQFDVAALVHGGRCVLCRDPQAWAHAQGLPAELQPTPEGQACPLRHFIGQVDTSFHIASSLPIRRKNAVSRRLWALFPGARNDPKTTAGRP